MLQFNTVPFQTTDGPIEPSLSAAQEAGQCSLGPTPQGLGVVLTVFNALVDLQLYFRDPTSPGYGLRPGPVVKGVAPVGQVFSGAVGFVATSTVKGSPAQVIAQVWETTDGPLPTPGVPINATLSPSGGVTPFSGGLEVTDGVNVVDPATVLDFTSGATVTDEGGGVAGIAVAGGPGALIDYVENPTDVHITSATEATPTYVIASNPFTLPNPNTRLNVKWNVMAIDASMPVGDIGIFANIWDFPAVGAPINLGRIAYNDITASTTYFAPHFNWDGYPLIAAAGTHTLKIGVWYQHAASIGGVCYGTDGGAAAPMYLRTAYA